MKSFLCDAQGIAELQRVKMVFLLIHHHHQVVTVLVIDHQLAVTVGNDATRRKLHFLQEGIRVGILLIVVAKNLKRQQAEQINDHNSNGHSPNHIAPVFEFVVAFHCLRRFSITRISTTVSSVLVEMHNSHCIQLKKLKASSEKKASV